MMSENTPEVEEVEFEAPPALDDIPEDADELVGEEVESDFDPNEEDDE